jgi:hypothetical protein
MYFSESGTHFGHSLLNAVHSVFGENILITKTWWPVVLVSLMTIILTVLLRMKISKKTSAETDVLTLSAIAGCLAPPTSTDYKLWYFLVPILWQASHNFELSLPKYYYLLPLLLFAKPYLYTGVQPWANATSYIPAIVMIILLFFIVREYMVQKRLLESKL